MQVNKSGFGSHLLKTFTVENKCENPMPLYCTLTSVFRYKEPDSVCIEKSMFIAWNPKCEY